MLNNFVDLHFYFVYLKKKSKEKEGNKKYGYMKWRKLLTISKKK
jgi:hypothetical protein